MQHGTVSLPTTKQECEEQLALLDVEIAETRKEYKAYFHDPAYKAWVRCALCMPTSGTNAEFHEIGSKKSLVSEERSQKLVSMLQECRQQNEKVDWTAVADAVNAAGDGCDLSKKQVAAHWYDTASRRVQNADLAKWFSGASSKKRKTQAATPPAATPTPARRQPKRQCQTTVAMKDSDSDCPAAAVRVSAASHHS